MAPIVEMMTMKMIVGLIIGTVILRSWVSPFAPSMVAASYSSRGTACIAARKIRAL